MPTRSPSSHQHLSVTGISRTFGDRRVLTEVSFTAAPGDCVGIIGENGSGKSTLLRIIAGLDEPDAGSVTHAAPFGVLAQELPYPDDAPIRRVLDDAQRATLTALVNIEVAARALSDADAEPAVDNAADAAAAQYAHAIETAERLEAWSAEARRGDALSGLGLSGIDASDRVGRLSGGQRRRLALAALLLEAPHTLILDEPSNHLDDHAMSYLETVLGSWRGIVLIASHDRTLLDAVTTKILDLDPVPIPASVLDSVLSDADDASNDPGTGVGVRVWGMGYTRARAERRAELARWRARHVAESEEHDALIHEVEIGSREVNRKHESKSEARITQKFYADKDARVTARRARNARVRLAQLERTRVRIPPDPLRFRGIGDAGGAERTASAEPALQVVQARVRGRLAPISFSLDAGERLLLTGPNGSGKSTLLSLIAGTRSPDDGEILRSGRLGYLPQEVTFADDARSAAETFAQRIGTEQAAHTDLVELGLLTARDVHRPVGLLSVGQRRRVALGVLLADPPPILLLDEPTNHLSLSLVEELEEALRDFRGALVVATHDRWWRSHWTGRVRELVPVPAESSG